MHVLRMSRLIIVGAAVFAFTGLASVSRASTTYNDWIRGAEYSATSTEGKFAGYASGDLLGYWNAVVDHTPLGSAATITGGSFSLDGLTDADGTFTGGSVTLNNPSSGCVNQSYAVQASLGSVSVGAATGGTGTFNGTLVHYRQWVFGRCVTYSATIRGSLSLSV
jgi:hypothetical protein